MHHKSGDGAKQPEIFSHERAAMLDDPEREGWLPTAASIELIDAPSGSRILDFGAGTGRYGLALAQARPDLRVVAYDVQPEMLAIVRRRATELGVANLEAADWAETQRAAPYARILAFNLLHEIDNETIGRLASLLAADGRALFLDWDANIDRPTGPPADHVHSVDEARDRLVRNGFARVERIQDPRFPYHFIFRAARA